MKRPLTADEVRARLSALIGKPLDRSCPTCNGSGRLTTPIRQTDVAAHAGLDKMTLNSFLHGKSQMYFENGLKLLAALEELERAASNAVGVPRAAPDESARNPATRGSEAERMRQLRNTSAAAAARAAVDAINRPISQ